MSADRGSVCHLNRTHESQPDTRPLTASNGGQEAAESLRLVGLRDAWAVVGHGNVNSMRGPYYTQSRSFRPVMARPQSEGLQILPLNTADSAGWAMHSR